MIWRRSLVENPTGTDVIDAEILQGQGRGLNLSSFVAIQQWAHDLETFTSMPQQEEDDIIGQLDLDACTA